MTAVGRLRIFLLALPCLAADSNARWNFLVTNLDVFPGTERLFEADDRLFWRLKPNLRDIAAAERLASGEFKFTVSTDASGRRAQPEAAGRTVLFLGDSCTFGIPVHDHETYPALVQKKLSGVRTINAGVPGYSAYQGRVLLESLTATPDAVVITFWPNDRSEWDQLSDLEHAELIAAERAGEFSRLKALRLLRKAVPSFRPRLSDEEFAAEIRRMIHWCRDRGSVPVVMVWPARREVDRQRLLRRIAREEKSRLVDLVPVFAGRAESEVFTDGIHSTRAGYALAAETLAPVIRAILKP